MHERKSFINRFNPGFFELFDENVHFDNEMRVRSIKKSAFLVYFAIDYHCGDVPIHTKILSEACFPVLFNIYLHFEIL